MPLNISGSIVNAGIARTLNYKSIVTRGLVFQADAGAPDSYPETGTSWTDISGNNIITTLTNGPTFSSDTGGYFSFDGTNDYSINTSFTAFQTTTGTIMGWAYPTTTSGDNYLMSVGGTTTYGASRAITNYLGVWRAIGYGSATEDYTIASIILNTWQHVVYAWSGTTINAYINGTLYTDTRSGLVTPQGSSLDIGKPSWTNSAYFTGRIANAQVYNRTLSTAEVVQNFNAQRGRFGV
jgi:hypothetical protein